MLLLPSVADLIGWAGVGFAVLALMGLGRGLSRGDAAPEIALITGWGVACWVLTIWGIILPISLRAPAGVMAALGVIGLILPRTRLTATEWRSLGRVALLSLPLLAVMASARPSQPDTFLNLLPNAAYLYDHGVFPAIGRPDAHSLLPAAPYNLQLASLFAGLVTPQFPANALVALNIALLLAAGLLLARLLVDDKGVETTPGWSAIAFGLLLATGLNPGFVPRYHVSGYSEPSVMVVVAVAGWLSCRRDRMSMWLLAAALAALVEIKQDSVALVLGITLAAAMQPREPDRRRLDAIAHAVVAAIPAAVLYLGWAWYTHVRFVNPDVELTWMPLAQWNWRVLPTVFDQIAHIMGEKAVFFAPLGIVLAAFAIRAWRGVGGDTPGQRAGLTLLIVTLVYNAALLVSYVGHFSGQMATDAHSFFRYNTHLALLLMVTLVLMLRAPARAWFVGLQPRQRRGLAALAIAAFLVSPIAFVRYLRFDLETPQLRAWNLAKHLASAVGPHDRLALVLPGDNGSLFPVLEGLLRMTPPRRPDVVLDDVPTLTPKTLDDVVADRWALISCTPTGMTGVPAGEAALFARHDGGWQMVDHWPYPPASRGHWSEVIAWPPLCLSGRSG